MTDPNPTPDAALLVAEDVLLLLADDKTGTIGEGTLFYTLGGAMLVELALLGRVTAEPGGRLKGEQISAVPGGPLADPLLQQSFDRVAEKPRGVQSLLIEVGQDLRRPLLERLLERGLIRQERHKILGLIPATRLPATLNGYEQELRERIRAVLEDGVEPDPHTAAVIALVSASGSLPSLHPVPRWDGTVATRAKAIEQGSWGAAAVSSAVLRTAPAIAVSSAVAVSTAISVATNR